MSVPCSVVGCKALVPPELEPARMCVAHFTLQVERTCMEMRLETVRSTTSPERRAEISRYIAEQGTLLARVATAGGRLPDEMKARILSTLLTLMNLRESMERFAERLRPGKPLKP